MLAALLLTYGLFILENLLVILMELQYFQTAPQKYDQTTLKASLLVKTLDRISLSWLTFCKSSVLCGKTDLVSTIQDRFLSSAVAEAGKRRMTVYVTLQSRPRQDIEALL